MGERIHVQRPQVRELLPSEIARLPMVPRALMKGAGITPSYSARLAIPVRPRRAGHDGDFFLEESGLSLSHVHVVEGIVASAFAAAELEPTNEAKMLGLPGELSLRFLPGDTLRAMGLRDGNRAWLRARLKELGSPIGDLPRKMGGGEFSVLRTMATDTPAGKVFANAIVGRAADGSLVRETVHASVWTVRLTSGYRAWMSSGASMRHSLLPQLRGLKCAAAEAVARYALTGRCNKSLNSLLEELGIVKPGWNTDTDSAIYRSARRAISGVLQAAPALAEMGVDVHVGGADGPTVLSSDEPKNCLFATTGTLFVGQRVGQRKQADAVRSQGAMPTSAKAGAGAHKSRFDALTRREPSRPKTCDLDASQ